MNMELNHLPIIDWNLATKIAGNKKEIAEEILEMFIKNLPKDIKAIKQLYLAQKYSELSQQVHKLHGTICYCGLPRLKTVVARLETDLRNNIMCNLPSLFDRLDVEVNLLLEQYHTATI